MLILAQVFNFFSASCPFVWPHFSPSSSKKFWVSLLSKQTRRMKTHKSMDFETGYSPQIYQLKVHVAETNCLNSLSYRQTFYEKLKSDKISNEMLDLGDYITLNISPAKQTGLYFFLDFSRVFKHEFFVLGTRLFYFLFLVSFLTLKFSIVCCIYSWAVFVCHFQLGKVWRGLGFLSPFNWSNGGPPKHYSSLNVCFQFVGT